MEANKIDKSCWFFHITTQWSGRVQQAYAGLPVQRCVSMHMANWKWLSFSGTITTRKLIVNDLDQLSRTQKCSKASWWYNQRTCREDRSNYWKKGHRSTESKPRSGQSIYHEGKVNRATVSDVLLDTGFWEQWLNITCWGEKWLRLSV